MRVPLLFFIGCFLLAGGLGACFVIQCRWPKVSGVSVEQLKTATFVDANAVIARLGQPNLILADEPYLGDATWVYNGDCGVKFAVTVRDQRVTSQFISHK